MNKHDPFVRFVLTTSIYVTLAVIVWSTLMLLSDPEPINSCAMLGGCK